MRKERFVKHVDVFFGTSARGRVYISDVDLTPLQVSTGYLEEDTTAGITIFGHKGAATPQFSFSAAQTKLSGRYLAIQTTAATDIEDVDIHFTEKGN